MANACATLIQFLEVAPEFGTSGPSSSGTVTFASNPTDGTTFDITDTFSIPNVVEQYTAKTTPVATNDYAIGGSAAVTAVNFAVKVTAESALVTATTIGVVVTLVSKTNGPDSRHAMTTSAPGVLVRSAETLEGGDALVQFSLDCACEQINLECWGNKADCGHIYLTAHTLSVLAGQEGGAVSSKRIDKIAISFAVSPSSDGELGSTKWGRLFLQLKKTVFVNPVIGRRTLVRLPF